MHYKEKQESEQSKWIREIEESKAHLESSHEFEKAKLNAQITELTEKSSNLSKLVNELRERIGMNNRKSPSQDPTTLKCLEKGIQEFYSQNQKTIKEIKQSVNLIYELLQENISEVLSDYKVGMFGSHATKLCLSWSDLDIVLFKDCNYNSKEASLERLNCLKKVNSELSNKSWIKSSKLIETASIPIIKLVSSDDLSNIKIDITIQDSRHCGLRCVDLINSYTEDYSSIEYLIIVLKQILKEADLNDPYKGGLSSYAITLMVVHFLQNLAPNEFSKSYLLVQFLIYYSHFDEKKYYIISKCKPEFSDKENSYSVSISLSI